MNDQEIEIINNETKKQKIVNFFVNNKKKFIYFIIIIFLSLLTLFFYQYKQESKRIDLADRYNNSVINFQKGDKKNIISVMSEIIETRDSTYSPLAFYFLLDNDLLSSKNEINNFFDILINETKLEKEIKNLIIYKKAIYNSDFVDENTLLSIIKPVINSDSVWKSHGLMLMAEYYIFKQEKQKSKEFLDQILLMENANLRIKQNAKKILQAEF